MEALTTLDDGRRGGIRETLHQLGKNTTAPSGRRQCNIRDTSSQQHWEKRDVSKLLDGAASGHRALYISGSTLTNDVVNLS